MKKVFNCTIEIQSPVHVGCDEVYEPTGFIVDESNSQLIHFDLFLFLSTLEPEDRDRFSAICQKGTLSSILEIYKFFRGRTAEGRRVNLCPGFLTHYQQTLGLAENRLQQELNRFFIQRTAFRTIDNRPYLPGSSIKGSLRTGYLNAVCQGKKMNTSHPDIEKRLLDYAAFEEDPFSKIKVSDFQPVGEIKTTIVYAVNKKKKQSDKEPRGPYQILEVIEPGALFQGKIEVNDAIFPHPLTGKKTGSVKKPIELEQLISGAVGFYLKEHHRENRELEDIHLPYLDLKGPEQGGNALPLRLGRHSGAKSVTIEGNRSIKIMLGGKKKPAFLDHATTIWLAANQQQASTASSLQPFGWITIAGLSPQNQNVLESQESTYIKRKQEQAETKMLQAAAKKKAEAEANRLEEERKAQLQRQQEKEELQKQALEKMGPEERFIYECDQDMVKEEQVNAMFNRLDDLSEEFKKEIASRLASYWQKNQMWEKKHAANHNQWKKFRARKEKLEQILSQ
jgi:CRISPR-associated protein Csm5